MKQQYKVTADKVRKNDHVVSNKRSQEQTCMACEGAFMVLHESMPKLLLRRHNLCQSCNVKLQSGSPIQNPSNSPKVNIAKTRLCSKNCFDFLKVLGKVKPTQTADSPKAQNVICSDRMGLTKQYLRVGQSAKNRLFGIPPVRRGPSLKSDRTPIQMLVSNQGDIHHGRVAVVVLGLFALALGIILSTVPWVDYLILKQLRLWNGTLSYYYWRQPGVNRLTKVWVFNVTNPDGFLHHHQKPKLQEIGPFVYREDMEKVNIQFHDNGTVSFQHKKILQFVPELSYRRDVKLFVPNIPLLTLTSMVANMPAVIRLPLSLGLRSVYKHPALIPLTPDELLFGFDEPLTALAHKFYPKGKRPPAKMGLLIGRNQSLLRDVETIYTGHTSMNDFGLMHKLNGLDHLPYWEEPPCNSIRASEGSLFPPRDVTQDDVIHIFDKDLCRIWPLRYREDDEKHGIKVGKYTPDDNIFTSGEKNPENKCFCPGKRNCPMDGLQDVSPCHFNSPVYLSFPHYYGMEPSEVTESVEGLTPSKEQHESVAYIQPKLGVPLEVRIRVQLNLKVTHSSLVSNFPSIMFPVVWVEEGAEEIPDYIIRWIYAATTMAQWSVPLAAYLTIALGALMIIAVFVKAYRSVVFTKENLERGKASTRKVIRRGSSFFVNGQHRLMILRDSYTLLQNTSTVAETSFAPDPLLRDSDDS